MTTTVTPFRDRVQAALDEVLFRIALVDQHLLRGVKVVVWQGFACDEPPGRRYFAEWQSQWQLIALHAGRCRPLSHRELVAVLGHEYAHAACWLREEDSGEAQADAQLRRWGFRCHDLPGYDDWLARQEAISLGGGGWPD
jgi:hypothetical protein